MADPAVEELIARERRLTIDQLLESRRVLAAELRRVNRMITDLEDGAKQPHKKVKYALAYGTVWTLRRYVRSLQPGDLTTPAEASEWMLANGWRTTSRTPQATVASAMKHMADRGDEGLEWAGTGKYQRA